MRWLLGRDPGECTACGAALHPGAGWCGACGARTTTEPSATAEEDVVLRPDDDALEVVDDGARGRRLTAALVIGLLVVAVTTVALREPPPRPLLGAVDARDGVTATGLPPPGLRLAWSHELPEDGSRGWWGDAGPIVVDGGLARVGTQVVDLATGRVVRMVVNGGWTDGRTESHVVGDTLVVVDTFTGAVLSRAELDADLPEGPRWAHQRTGGMTVMSFDSGESVVVDDSGRVVTRFEGVFQQYGDVAWDEPVALPVRLHGASGPTSTLRLVTLDGRVVLERADGGRETMLAEVRGNRAIVSQRRPPSGARIPTWDVEYVDAATGTVLASIEVEGANVPRLVGVTEEDEPLLVTTSGLLVQVWGLRASGAVPVIEFERTREQMEMDGWGPSGVGTGGAGVTDSGLVVVLDGEEVVAWAPEGVAWRADAHDAVQLRVDGDVVGLLPSPQVQPGDETSFRLLDGTDGSRLGMIPSRAQFHELQWSPRPMAVLDGVVAVGQVRGWPGYQSMELGMSRWLDVATGEAVGHDDALARWLGGDAPARIGAGWVLNGISHDDAGVAAPVLTWSPNRTALQVLEAGEVVTYELPVPKPEATAEHYTEPIGASNGRIALWGQVWDGTGEEWSTYVLDRASGEIVTVPDLVGTLLTDDVLVGHRVDRRTWQSAELVAADPATGDVLWEVDPLVDAFNYGGAPRHDDEVLLVADPFGVTATDLVDGNHRWRHTADTELLPTPVLGPVAVLVATTTGELLALDRTDGSELWRVDLGSPITSLSGAGGGAVLGTIAGDVVVLDDRGREVQRVTLDGPVDHVAAVGETVVAIVDGHVVGLRTDGNGIVLDDEVELP